MNVQLKVDAVELHTSIVISLSLYLQMILIISTYQYIRKDQSAVL